MHGFSQGLLNLCHRWSFGSLPLSPLADYTDIIGRELNWMMSTLNHQWTDFNWKNDLLMSSFIIDKLFFLFDSVKLLWHNQYCIKRYINKGDLTWLYILYTWCTPGVHYTPGAFVFYFIFLLLPHFKYVIWTVVIFVNVCFLTFCLACFVFLSSLNKVLLYYRCNVCWSIKGIV